MCPCEGLPHISTQPLHNRKECKCLVQGNGFRLVCVCVWVFVCLVTEAGGYSCPHMFQAVSQNRDTEWNPPLPSAGLTQDLADGGVVHVRKGLQDPPALVLGPHHEGIHGSLDVARGGRGPGLSIAAWDRDGQSTYRKDGYSQRTALNCCWNMLLIPP